MIPLNRPVVGKDLDSVRQEFGMLTSDACWVFGMSITKWTEVVRKNADKPLNDPSLALLVRFLDQHPELQIVPKFPEAQEMFRLVQEIQDIDQKRFSVLFGSEFSATYRWLKPGSRMSPAVARLMHYMRLHLLASKPRSRAEVLQDWRTTVELEARARGAKDVFKSGDWGRPKKPREDKPEKPMKPRANKVAAPARKRTAKAAAPARKPAAKAAAPARKRAARKVASKSPQEQLRLNQ